MIKVTVMYPKSEGSRFDMDYYTNKHVPKVWQLVGDACKKGEIERGLSGPRPDMPPTYGVIAHLYFDSLEEFQSSFMPHVSEIMGDIPNFSNIQPMIQISQVIT